MSTVSPGLSRLLDAEHEAHGKGYVAAPVLATPYRGVNVLIVLRGFCGALGQLAMKSDDTDGY
jgi:hypothetical protein